MKTWTSCRAVLCGAGGAAFGVQGYPGGGRERSAGLASAVRAGPQGCGIRVTPLRRRRALVS